MDIRFEFEKATKNTYRYAEAPEVGKPAVIGTLYVAKWAYPNQPQVLTVTVKEA